MCLLTHLRVYFASNFCPLRTNEFFLGIFCFFIFFILYFIYLFIYLHKSGGAKAPLAPPSAWSLLVGAFYLSRICAATTKFSNARVETALP